MPARIFRTMPKVFLKTFGETTKALWQRHDAETADEISVIFNRAYAQLDLAGIAIDDARPTAWISETEAKVLAPGRDLDVLFDNDDTITIAGTEYKITTGRPDGYGMIEIDLRK